MVLACRRHIAGTDMAIKNALASVAVSDLNTALRWYERVLGRPPDSRPMPEVGEWSSSGRLAAGLQPPGTGSGSVTLAVSSIDEHIAQLNTLGIDTGQRSSGESPSPRRSTRAWLSDSASRGRHLSDPRLASDACSGYQRSRRSTVEKM